MPLTELGLYKPPRRKAAAAQQLSHGEQQQPHAVQPPAVSPPTTSSSSSDLQKSQQQLVPDVLDWGATIRSTWDISERGALQLLNTFLSSATGLSAYESARSYADGRSVSKLSPYLHFGQLSARLMWQRMKVAK